MRNGVFVTSSDDSYTHDIQLSSQIRCTTVLRLASVTCMIFKELALVLQSRRNGLGVVDISLTSIYDWNITESKRDDTTGKDVDYVRSLIPVSLGFRCQVG
jgi:uncharacterized protein YdeI (YjbR/CyaY-like superfamily)